MTDTNSNTLEALFECALDLICVANSDGFFEKLSPVWTERLGWTEEELQSKPFLDFVHPDDRNATIEMAKRLFAGENIVDFENRYRTKDGTYCWLQWRARSNAKQSDTIFAIARDITDIKQQQIRTNNEIRLLELAEQTARVGHWRLDTNTGHLDWSNEVFKIYNRKPHKAKITLDDFLDAYSIEDRARMWGLIQQAIQDGSEINTELSLVHPNGKRRNIAVRAVCEKGAHNNVEGLFGILQDVTKERQRQDSLRHKEELLSIAFRATSDGIWDWDMRTDQMWYSPQWKKQLGYEEDELINRFDTWADLIFEEDRLNAMDQLEMHISGKNDRFEMIQRFRHKKGHTVFILSRAFAIRDKNGRAIRMVGAHTDVTELKRLEQAKSEFTSIVSHELRTPLTAIHGAIGLLNGHFSEGLPEQVQSLIKVANNNSERLILLINDILDMEKLQSGKMDFDLREMALGEFLPQAVENHISYAKQYNVNIDFDHDMDALAVIGDPHRLMQVMSNLLSNAVKFSNENGIVKIRAVLRNGKVSISVSDKGKGIAPEMRERIFDKFIQADSSDQRRKGGTGLGLAISKAMITNMNGTISVVSALNQGSTFTITLPHA